VVGASREVTATQCKIDSQSCYTYVSHYIYRVQVVTKQGHRRHKETTVLRAKTITVSSHQDVAVNIIGRTKLTEGNIKNHHIYLHEFFDAFPKDVVGGSNIAAAAQKTISVEWGGGCVAITDLDGKKKFFRKRGWVREFFARTRAVAGDTVLVQLIGPYDYRVTLQRA
jgi:hypothetical protein